MEQQEDPIYEWVANQQYCRRNLIAVVTRNVRAVKNESDGYSGEAFANSIRALIELHTLSIKGLVTGFSPDGEYESQAWFMWNERYGRPIDRLLHYWRRRYDQFCHLRDPEGETIEREDVTIDVMFIEPDPTHTKIMSAWKGMNLWPIEYNGIDSKRDLWSPGPRLGVLNPTLFGKFNTRQRWPQGTRLKVCMEGQYHRGNEVDEEAQKILDQIILTAVNPYTEQAFVDSIAKSVSATTQPT